ncbi:MAG: ornithine carbamoyltransferase, partial [Alphaproteobacteria bacterium]|nr:ornithine carbamoyltransferase [Alphaproteobacteria bacterium]
GLFKFRVNIGCPEGYEPEQRYVVAARDAGATISIMRDPELAVAGADVVVTDTWVSMGQHHAQEKLTAMMPFQVNARLMAYAKPSAQFLHCLPAHRDEEATADVLDGPQSRIWDEAENRLHAQKAVLLWCLGRL